MRINDRCCCCDGVNRKTGEIREMIFFLFSLDFWGFDKWKETGAIIMKRILCWLGKHKWSYCYGSNQVYCEYCGKAKLKDKDVRSTMIRG